MEIYLVRHGEAIEQTSAVDDSVRWLTPKGRKAVGKAACRLQKYRVRPGLIITSPLTRAVQTAELLAAGVGSRAQLRADNCLSTEGSIEQTLELIRSSTGTDQLMLVGHEPLLSQVAAVLLGINRMAGLAKGGCLALKLRDKPDRPAKLLWYAVPGRKLSKTAKKLLEPADKA